MRIGLCGKSGSGKSTVADYLESKHGFTVVRPGAICRRITRELFDTDDKTTLNLVNDAMRKIDPNVWINAALRPIKMTHRIAIDGVRFASNFAMLQPKGYQFWHIIAAQDAAQARLKHRGQDFDIAIDALHAGEHEFVSFTFDATLFNDGSVQDLLDQVDTIL